MYSSDMSFRKRGSSGNPDGETPEEVDRRFEELAAATPELGGLGPRDWTPAEDTEGFVPPNPPLPSLPRRALIGWVLLVASIIGFIILGITQPSFAPALATLCLVALALSLGLLLPRRRR